MESKTHISFSTIQGFQRVMPVHSMMLMIHDRKYYIDNIYNAGCSFEVPRDEYKRVEELLKKGQP